MWLALLALTASADDTTWKQLHSPQATASSYLQSNWNKFTENYHPTYILDGNPKTAWVEGATGNGEGSWVGWPVSRVPAARRVKLRIRNGYHKSQNLLVANAAPSVIRVELRDGERVVYSREAQLRRDLSWQEVVLDPPLDVPVDGIRIVVVAAHKGSAYADLCISDVETWIDADAPYNAPIEKAKHQVALGWIRARVDAAAWFANQPKEYPFAATQFRASTERVDDATAAAWGAEHATAVGAVTALLGESTPWRRVDVKSPPRLPEGLDLPTGAERWFASDRAFFEADEEWRFQKAGENEWIREVAESNVRMSTHPDGITPRLAALHTRQVVEERGTYTTTARWLVSFDPEGHTTEIFVVSEDSGDEVCSGYTDHKRFTFVRQAGKVVRVDGRHRNWCSGGWTMPDEYVETPTQDRVVWTPAT
jgi:hypothetical protein